MRNFLLLFIACCMTYGCTKSKFNEQSIEADRSIESAELLLADNPTKSFEILDGIKSVEELDEQVQVRWCIVYGKAANELRKNKLLPEELFEKVYVQNNKSFNSVEDSWFMFFLANIAIEQKDVTKAMPLYEKSLELAKKNNDCLLAGSIHSTIAWTSWEDVNIDKAIEYYKLAAEYYKRIANLSRQIEALSNIANLCNEKRMNKEALEYAQEADSLAKITQNRIKMGISSSVLSQAYRGLGDYNLAVNYAMKAIELDPENSAPVYISIAKIYMGQEKYDSAHLSLDMAAKASSLNPFTPRGIAKLRYELAKAEHKKDDENKYHLQYIILRDSLSLAASVEQLELAKKRINNAKHNNEELQKKLRLQYIFMGVGGALFLVAIGILCYILFFRKKKKEVKLDVADIIRQNERDLAILDWQEDKLQKVETRAYRRMARKKLLTPEQLEMFEIIVKEEIKKQEKKNDIDTDDI